MSLTEAWSLSVTSTGNVGIEKPRKNLLVMERTYISFRYQYRDSDNSQVISEFLLSMGKVMG